MIWGDIVETDLEYTTPVFGPAKDLPFVASVAESQVRHWAWCSDVVAGCVLMLCLLGRKPIGTYKRSVRMLNSGPEPMGLSLICPLPGSLWGSPCSNTHPSCMVSGPNQQMVHPQLISDPERCIDGLLLLVGWLVEGIHNGTSGAST